jgi:hypothetical protein
MKEITRKTTLKARWDQNVLAKLLAERRALNSV